MHKFPVWVTELTMHLCSQNLYQDIYIIVTNWTNWSCSSYWFLSESLKSNKQTNRQTNKNPGKTMGWNFLCNFTKLKFSSRNLCKIRSAWFGSLYEHSLASKVFFFPPTLSPVLACSSAGSVSVCVSVSVLPCTQRQKISFSLQIRTWNLHRVSIKQLYENKGACSFLVILPTVY